MYNIYMSKKAEKILKNPKIYIKLAQSYIHAKKYDEAKKYLNISIKKVQNDEQKSMAYDNLEDNLYQD